MYKDEQFEIKGLDMKFIAALSLVFFLVQPAYSQMYKCESGGKVSFQQMSCSSGKESVLNTQTPTRADINPEAEYSKGVTIGAFSLRYEPRNSIGSTWFAYKVGVTNNTSEETEISLKYNAVDRDGFLIKDVSLRGAVPAHSFKILSDRNYLDKNEKERIYKWELEK